MSDDDLDRLLSEKDDIVPSSGFASSVMDAVRREATAPPPIPFPWKRALPGVVGAAAGLAWVLVCVVSLVRAAAGKQVAPAQLNVLSPILQTMINARVGSMTLVLLVTLGSVMFSIRLASGRN
jgi:hypothetical protein